MHIPPHGGRNRPYGCGELREPVTRAVLHWETSHGGRARSIASPEFRLRPGRGSNKAHWGLDRPGTVEPVDKRSIIRCDPASCPVYCTRRTVTWQGTDPALARGSRLCP